MKKRKFLIICAILVILIGASAASASAFDFVGWLKKILGIKLSETEEPTEIFVPIEDIKIEEIEEEITEGAEEEAEGEKTAEEAEEEAGEEKAEEEAEEAAPEEAEEAEKEPAGEGAKVVIAEETEKVSLKIDAEDPDADSITIEYSSPLDKNGEWQTTYGDAGEYTVTITVSDGTLSASDDVLVIVNRKEEAPTINSFEPESLTLEAKEDTKLEFKIAASDKNKDKLKYLWQLDDAEASTKDSFVYEMGYDDAGSHTVKAIVSDGKLEAKKAWSVEVKNVNRKPKLEAIADITVKETETVEIRKEATDPDGDEITYTISDPVGDDGVWKTGYDDAGEYEVGVTASDGEYDISQTVKITVENVNRAPVIRDIVQK